MEWLWCRFITIDEIASLPVLVVLVLVVNISIVVHVAI